MQQDAGLLDSFVLRPGAEGYADAIASNGSRDYARTDVKAATALLAEAGVVSPTRLHPVRPVQPAPGRASSG